MGGIGNARAKVYDAERPSTRFADMAGYEGAKREVSEVVDFLKHPDRYAAGRRRRPQGRAHGRAAGDRQDAARPGGGRRGRRATSSRSPVPASWRCSSGVGASRVRDLFAEARKRAPSIVFIDEIDAIGQRRGGQFVSNDERDQTLNQLLAEMDGFDPATGVVVMAATNRPETLDPALLRPGRFDRQVVIPLPTQDERRAILAVHARGKQLGPDVDLDVVARAHPGLLRGRPGQPGQRGGHLRRAGRPGRDQRRRLLRGPGPDPARAAGQLATPCCPTRSGRWPSTSPATPWSRPSPSTATRWPRSPSCPPGRPSGVTEQLPIDERHLYTEGYLKDSLAIRMGGRVAEQIVFGQTSTGASNDLAGATDLATRMVREFGMSETLGPVGFASGSPLYLGGEEVRSRPYAEATQRVIDEEVGKLLREAERPGHGHAHRAPRRARPTHRPPPGARDRRRHRRRRRAPVIDAPPQPVPNRGAGADARPGAVQQR